DGSGDRQCGTQNPDSTPRAIRKEAWRLCGTIWHCSTTSRRPGRALLACQRSGQDPCRLRLQNGRRGMTQLRSVSERFSGADLGRAVAALRASLHGQLLQPADDGYDSGRLIWNGMFDKKPALIACCSCPGDVIAAVNFARETGMLVAVRGGGHNSSGSGSCDGGILIDLSGMKAVHVDPGTRRARVEGGATWADFDHAAQVHGLATPGGVVSATGVGGLTLAGGLGWLRGKYGLSLDNLTSVDIVTADGMLRTANENENSELFWAVRGGGGNFGVVCTF